LTFWPLVDFWPPEPFFDNCSRRIRFRY
jgi:hypothetical protein